uniref:Uncharacterized protein n=1 Tax=Romanomermis culicivorax TaxID=13658 RepID=A0A915I8K1_ROMCU
MFWPDPLATYLQRFIKFEEPLSVSQQMTHFVANETRCVRITFKDIATIMIISNRITLKRKV